MLKKSKRKSKSIRKKSKSVKKDNIIYLKKSSRPEKKFMVIIGNKTVHFGQK